MARPVARSSFIQPKQITPSTYFQAVRCYAASAGLSQDEVTGRIMDLLKNFDKVKALCTLWSTVVANFESRSRILQRYQTQPFGLDGLYTDHNRQLNAESHFHNDLGLDSLDTVEVVMAIEEVNCGIWTLHATSTDTEAGIQH
jgi:hypothetical protein